MSVKWSAPELTRDGHLELAQFECTPLASDSGWVLTRNGSPLLKLTGSYRLVQGIYWYKHLSLITTLLSRGRESKAMTLTLKPIFFCVWLLCCLFCFSSGICGTDLDRIHFPFPLPQVVGHEVVGRLMDSSSSLSLSGGGGGGGGRQGAAAAADDGAYVCVEINDSHLAHAPPHNGVTEHTTEHTIEHTAGLPHGSHGHGGHGSLSGCAFCVCGLDSQCPSRFSFSSFSFSSFSFLLFSFLLFSFSSFFFSSFFFFFFFFSSFSFLLFLFFFFTSL